MLTFLTIFNRLCCIYCDYLNFSKLTLIKLLLQMGQSESADNEDDNCFRACVKQKKEKSKKMQALPYHPQHKDSRFGRKSPDGILPQQDYNLLAAYPAVHNNNQTTFETSLDYRLSCQQAKLKRKISLQNQANPVGNAAKDGCTQQKSLDVSRQMVLGLQSKFSSSKHVYSFTTAKVISQKGNVERNSAGTRCSSHEKESGSQSQITNKTNQSSDTRKSKKVLKNKIEEIKQKYYERELEIEICHDEREYQEQIEKIGHIDKTIAGNGQLPEQSIGEIKAARNKILAKLKEKKQINGVEKEAKDEPSLHLTINQSLTVQDQLEIYSREGKVLFQQTLVESQTLKKSKRSKNVMTHSGKDQVNRSINASRPNCSAEQEVQFSDYSEVSLHQIRELDEQYEDYRSKVNGLSSFKNNNQGLKPQAENNSAIPRSGIASRRSANIPADSFLQQTSSHLKKQKIPDQNPSNPSIISKPSLQNQPHASQPPKLSLSPQL